MVRVLLVLIVMLAAAAAVAESRTACSGAAGGPCPPYDIDGDGVRNEPPYPPGPDNCPKTKNADQQNHDGDGLGDACDVDDDGDGVNDQADSDGDGYGDVPASPPDNCRLVANPGQEDENGDGYGDACPPVDTDGDGATDDRDNCVKTPNPDQADNERDLIGDVCDGDDDDDRVPDYMDNCPFVDNPSQEDRDGNGKGTACDPDELRSAPPESTPPPGTGGGSQPGTTTTAATDRTAPTLRLSSTATWTADDLRGRAPLSVRCSEACGLTARLTLRGRTLASGTALLGGRGRTYIFFSPRRGAVRRVARLRTRARAVLSVSVVDEAGNRRSATRRVWLRR